MGETIKVAVTGALGRMGREVVQALTPGEGFEIVAAIDRNGEGKRLRDEVGPNVPDLVVESKLGAALDRTQPDVLVDFTIHSAALAHGLSALKRGISPVIGTTGLKSDEINELRLESKEQKVPGIYAPNFALGAVLMVRFAEMAAKWMPDVEVIELHHEQKLDAPSGTALLTAERIDAARSKPALERPDQLIKVPGARGALAHHVHVHSVRLPGLLAHQEVIFGGKGETLRIQHDSYSRTSFMEGVKLCCREVRSLEGFVVGMDRILFG